MQNTTTQFNTEAALARGNIYGLLSQAYLYPSEEFFGMLQSEAFASELRESVATLPEIKSDGSLKQGVDSVIEELSKAAQNSLSELRSEYYNVFGHTISKECPPYETQYGMAHLFQQTEELGNVSGFYRAFGLEVKNVERLDHISVEMEFMHFLCYKQAYAMENNHGEEKAGICLEAQKKFIRQHLGKWAFAFAKLLKKTESNGFYRSLAELTESFLSFELAYLNVKPKEPSMELTPVPSMREESCFSCSNDSRGI